MEEDGEVKWPATAPMADLIYRDAQDGFGANNLTFISVSLSYGEQSMEKFTTLIAQKKEKFSTHEFLLFLKDEEVPLKRRLSFLPSLSHFVMSFGDINKLVLPFKEPKNELERAVNTHAMEDANHWPWFLNDLKKMNLNNHASLTDQLEFLWSENRKNCRMLTYELIRLIANQPANLRLIAIEVMEATGNTTFDVLTKITEGSGLTLEYCGKTHLNQETGHTIGGNEELIDTLNYYDKEKEQAITIITDGFSAFENFFSELMRNKKHAE